MSTSRCIIASLQNEPTCLSLRLMSNINGTPVSLSATIPLSHPRLRPPRALSLIPAGRRHKPLVSQHRSHRSFCKMAPLLRILKLLCLLPSLHHRHHCDAKRRNSNASGRKRRKGCGFVDRCCWLIGYICTAWWVLLLIYNSLPSAKLALESPGAKLKREGLQAWHPVVLVPGVFAGELELWEGKACADDLFRQRLWGGIFGDMFKRPKCWMEHMILDNETGLDPPGVRVRPVPGLAAAGYFTGLIENLARIGYEGKNMYMAAYDWRLSFQNTEVRDQSLSRLKSQIELMVKTSGDKRVVVVPYSTGALYFLHFLKWVETPPPMGGGGGRGWCSQHIKAVMNVGPAFLGVPRAINGIFSDEAKEMDYVIRSISHGVLDRNIFGFEALQHIMLVSRTWDSIHYMSAKGRDSIWGGINWSMQGGFDCETRNKRILISTSGTSPSNESDGKVGFWVRMMARYARIILFERMSRSSSELPFADSKKLLVDPTFLQTKSSEPNLKSLGSDIDEGIQTIAKNKVYISRTFHDLLCFVAPKMLHRAHTHFSHGTADELDDPKYSHYKYWSNPLETKLPDAPDIEIFCLYGVDDTVTEQLDDNKFSPSALLSAGYMCAKGWRGKTRFNPSGIPTYVREYTHKTAANLLVSRSNAHTDIMGNSALIEDIMRVAAGASGDCIGGDRIHSSILSISDSVKLNVG